MTTRGNLIFSGCVLGHAIVSCFTAAWCVGVSMAILDSGGTEAPFSLSLICLVHVVTRYPLKPLTDFLIGATSPVQPTYWLSILLNSLVVVSIIFLVVHALRRLLCSQITPKT
jgi:hypothetical protein